MKLDTLLWPAVLLGGLLLLVLGYVATSTRPSDDHALYFSGLQSDAAPSSTGSAQRVSRIGEGLKGDPRRQAVMTAIASYRAALQANASDLPEDRAHDRQMAIAHLGALLEDDREEFESRLASDEIAAELAGFLENEPDEVVRRGLVEALSCGHSSLVAEGLWRALGDEDLDVREEARFQIEWLLGNRKLARTPARRVLFQKIRNGVANEEASDHARANEWMAWLEAEGVSES